MAHWLIIALIVLMVLVVLGFFGLMFAEMASKRKTGKSTARRVSGAGTNARKPARQRKSR